MNFRNNFLNILEGRKADNFPTTEFMWFWPECCSAYKIAAGTEDLAAHFELGGVSVIPYDFNPVPAFEEVIIEETEKHITKIDSTGITLKIEKGTSAMPHYIDFPIKDRVSYEQFLKRFNPLDEDRYIHLKTYKENTKDLDCPVELVIRGIFAYLRDFIMFDELMMMFYDEPELIEEIINNHTDYIIAAFGKVFETIIPDMVYLGEDMAYKNGSMISPEMIERFIYPAWVRVINYCKEKEIKHIILDSDGNISDILPFAVKAGFTCVLPVERAAGMDGEEIRRKYPTLAMIGGVDKLEIAKGGEAITREVEKAARLYNTGRYIPSFDHSVPPIIRYEDYKKYIETLKSRLT